MSTKATRCRVHKYHKIDLGYATVFACAEPSCTHYMPKHMEQILEGKNSICWACGEKFMMDSDALKMQRPQCMNCRMGVIKSEESEPMSEALKELLAKLET